MGNRESSSTSDDHQLLDYENAKTYITADEFKRIESAWNGREFINEEDFFHEFICNNSISEHVRSLIFNKFSQSSSKLSFQTFFIAIIILTKANEEVRRAFLKNEAELVEWIEKPPELTSHLSEIHYNFYQVLSGVTHLDESEIEELEKVFATINDTKLCKLTRNGFYSMVSGAIEDCFIDGLFRAFDDNADELIDFKELVCGLSASCRGPHTARLNFIAQMFDSDSDGYITKNDIEKLYDTFFVDESDRTLQTDLSDKISLADFVCWANGTSIFNLLLEHVLQVGHICLGLKPSNPNDELMIVSGFKERIDLEAFTEWNIVSSEWWKQWVFALMSNTNVPPINNASIISTQPRNDWTNKVPSLSKEGAPLKNALVEGKDYEKLPPCLWRALLRWHGSASRDGISLLRRAVPITLINSSCAQSLKLVLELHPLSLLILRHGTASGGWLHSAFEWNKENNLKYIPWCLLSLSRASTVRDLLNLLIQQLRINDTDSARLWTIEIDGKHNRRLLQDDFLILHDLNIKNDAQLLLEVRNTDMSWIEEISRLESNNESGDVSEDENAKNKPGVVGIYNTGNTCYISSALQCLSNTRPLTQFFLDGKHKKANAVGAVAKEYSNVVEELWSGKKKSVSPTKLHLSVKNVSGFFGDRSQHDSQEFTIVLLDLLHEDLKGDSVKSNINVGDSDGRSDYVVAKEAWDAHLTKGQTIITELFVGQLKSSLVCQTCHTSSNRFDAFMCLQLPLPMDNFLLVPVIVVGCSGDTPVRYFYRLTIESTIGDLRKRVANDCQLSINSFHIIALDRTGKLIRNVKDAAENDETSLLSFEVEVLFYAFELSIETDLQETVPDKNKTLIAVHRKMHYNDSYLLGASNGCRVIIFGVPLVLYLDFEKTTGNEIYREVWRRVSRFLPNDSNRNRKHRRANRAIDAGEDLRSGYPFDLRVLADDFKWCSSCCWMMYCRGCILPQTDEPVGFNPVSIAIDWKPAALYLGCHNSVELQCSDHPSVLQSWQEHHQPCSLASCLNDFTKSEELLDAEFFCKNCSEKTRMAKSLSIWKPPRILFVHFKRFICTDPKRGWMKSYKVVDFPLIDFDLCPWMVDKTIKDCKYNCFAIVNHYGDMVSGHYITYAKNEDQWYSFNDSKSQPVKESDIKKEDVYMLFYERQN